MEGKITDKGAVSSRSTAATTLFPRALQRPKLNQEKDGSVAQRGLAYWADISVAGNLAENGEITAKTISIEAQASENQ